MKWKIYSIFLIFSLCLVAIIVRNFNVESDIYALINLDKNDKIITQNMRESLSNEIIFLSNSVEVLDDLKARNTKYQIFSNIIDSLKSDTNASTKKILDSYKLATLDYETYKQIIAQGTDFTRNAMTNIFNAFEIRILPLQNDFLNLTAHSSLLKSNMSVDFSNGRIFANYNGKKYYIARGILSNNIKSSILLNFISESKSIANKKNAILLSSGGVIFSSVGENRGNIESTYMSILSLSLISILLFGAFGSAHIFKLIVIIIFAFLCGLAGGFALLDKVHILSIVISTSLIGLVLDFSMHFLSLNYKKKLPISNLKKVFFIGLLIACSGYAIFFLSPMGFLHQIATISIFTLLGAMVATYFLLPQMINSQMKPKIMFRFCLLNYILWLKRYSKKWFILPFAIVICSIPFMTKFDFNDNIKHYYAPPQALLDETIAISEIMQEASNTQFITISGKNSDDLIAKERDLGQILKEMGIISDYSGISSIFLSPKEQGRVKEILLDSIHKNIKFLKDLGFDRSTISDILNQIKQLEIIDFQDNLYNIFDIFKLNRFVVSNINYNIDLDNFNETKTVPQSIIFLKNPNFLQSNKGEINAILDAYNARFIDFNASVNRGFESIKRNAIVLKILAFFSAFVILSVCFGLKMGAIMTLLVLSATILSLCILIVCGVSVNVFSIFGLILASVVGIDYMIFALHQSRIRAILGIALASLTSIISFVVLATSQFGALFAFGSATSLCMTLCAIFASILAMNKTTGIYTKLSNEPKQME